MTDTRTTSFVQVTEALAERALILANVRVAPESWMSLEFELEPGKRGFAAAARVVVDPTGSASEESIQFDVRVAEALALVAAEPAFQVPDVRTLRALHTETSAEARAAQAALGASAQGTPAISTPKPHASAPQAKPKAQVSSVRKSLEAARARAAVAGAADDAEAEEGEGSQQSNLEFGAYLATLGLGGFVKPLAKIMVVDQDSLTLYESVGALESTLRESGALPKRFVMTEPMIKAFMTTGLTRGAKYGPMSWLEVVGEHSAAQRRKGAEGRADAKEAAPAKTAAKTTGPGSSLYEIEHDAETSDGADDEEPECAVGSDDGEDSGPEQSDAPEGGGEEGEGGKAAKGGKRRSSQPPRSTVTVDAGDAPFTYMLVGAGPVGAEDMADLAQAAGALAGRAAFPAGIPSSFKRICDTLEVLLEHAVEKGLVLPAELRGACAGADTSKAYRLLQRKGMRAAASTSAEGGEGDSASKGGLGEGLAAAMLEASSGGRVSESDAKIAEELNASRTRVDAVVRDNEQRENLMALKATFGSDMSAPDKLTAFAKVINNNAKVANLLYSAHVREPTGARALEFGGEARRVVDAYRACRSGLGSAMRAVTREMLPDNAEGSVLVEAIFQGKLASKAGRSFSVRDVAIPKAAKSWLGTDANKEPPKGAEERNSLALLFTIWHPLSYGLQTIHPHDDTVSRTIGILGAAVAKGARTHGVLTSVDSVVQPFLRQLEESWDAFQKTTDAAKPTLGKVWEEVSRSSQVAGYLAQASMQAASPSSSSKSSEGDAASTAIKALQKSVAQLSAKMDSSNRTKPKVEPSEKAKKKKPSLTKVYEGVTDDEIDAISDAELGDRPENAGDNWARNRKAVKAYKKKHGSV